MRELCSIILFVMLSVTTSVSAEGQGAQSDSVATSRPFTDSVEVRAPAPEALEAYRGNPDFEYERAQTGTSWWERFRRWMWRTFFKHILNPLGEWQRPLLYILLGATLLFALVQFTRMRAGSGWKVPARQMPQTFREIEENLQEIDLEAFVEEAAAEGDYRRAVRLLYLHALRTLADQGLIDWNPAKTNRAYLHELDRPALREALAVLTRLFERVWYGHAVVEAETFRRLRPRFERFCQRVEQVKEVPEDATPVAA